MAPAAANAIATIEAVATPLIFGRSPTQNVVALRRRFEPIVDALASQVGVPIELEIGASYDATRRAMLEQRYDLALVGPALWLDAHDRGANYRPCARTLRRGARDYRACIVAMPGRFDRLEELRGAQLAFVNRASVGGYAAALPLLERAGIGLEDLGGYRFVGGHDNVLRAVRSGQADAGVVFDGAWSTLPDAHLAAFEPAVLAVSEPIPNEPVSIAARLWTRQPDVAQSLERAIFELHEHAPGRAAIAAQREDITRFVPVSDKTYLDARELIAGALAPLRS